MQAVCNGDQRAFATLVHRHIDALHNYAARLSGSRPAAEDLVQDTWLAVWQKARTFKPGKVRLTTWLHRILHNKFIDGARRRTETHTGNEALEHVEDNGHADSLESAQTRAALYRALNQLPPDQRAALLLSHAQGFSNTEVAQILGLSVRAVESQQARGRRALKQVLGSESSNTGADNE